MKYTFSIITACLVICTACRKSGHRLPLQSDHGCVERLIIPVSAHSIDPAEVITVNNLLGKYAIDYSNLRYYRYRQEPAPTFYPPFTTYDLKHIRVDQYTNGLRIFNGGMIFNFFNDSLHAPEGDFTKGTTLDTIPRLTLYQLRKLFVDDVERFDHVSERYKECLQCEFGYYRLKSGRYAMPEMLEKAWRVTPKNHGYPLAYYKDNGVLISYDNGIRTFQ